MLCITISLNQKNWSVSQAPPIKMQKPYICMVPSQMPHVSTKSPVAFYAFKLRWWTYFLWWHCVYCDCKCRLVSCGWDGMGWDVYENGRTRIIMRKQLFNVHGWGWNGHLISSFWMPFILVSILALFIGEDNVGTLILQP